MTSSRYTNTSNRDERTLCPGYLGGICLITARACRTYKQRNRLTRRKLPDDNGNRRCRNGEHYGPYLSVQKRRRNRPIYGRGYRSSRSPNAILHRPYNNGRPGERFNKIRKVVVFRRNDVVRGEGE